MRSATRMTFKAPGKSVGLKRKCSQSAAREGMCTKVAATEARKQDLLMCHHPKAPESEDKVEFNPRTKSGKMAIAAAQKLTELAHRWVGCLDRSDHPRDGCGASRALFYRGMGSA
eukprot:1160149-Pelagomonas_calceolata.AAC.10